MEDTLDSARAAANIFAVPEAQAAPSDQSCGHPGEQITRRHQLPDT